MNAASISAGVSTVQRDLPVHHDTTVDGFAFFVGDKKIAVVTTKQQGAPTAEMVNGLPVARYGMVPMPRSSWRIHFTSPVQPVELLEAIVAAIPKDDAQEQLTERQQS
jgi:hypothetical protein